MLNGMNHRPIHIRYICEQIRAGREGKGCGCYISKADINVVVNYYCIYAL